MKHARTVSVLWTNFGENHKGIFDRPNPIFFIFHIKGSPPRAPPLPFAYPPRRRRRAGNMYPHDTNTASQHVTISFLLTKGSVVLL